MFANFFWGSRLHAIKWELICKPKLEGGLGIRNIKETNIAAGAKLLWKITCDSSSVWSSFIRNKYLLNEDIASTTPTLSDSGSWKFVLSVRDSLPPNTFAQGASWPSAPPNPGLKFFWNLTRARSPPIPHYASLWFPHHCPKMSTCLWRAANKSLLTKEFLVRRTLATDDVCPLCKNPGESVDHLFFQCSYTAFVWSVCRLKLGLTQKNSYSLLEEMELLKQKFKKRSGLKQLARLAIPTVVWQLWRERNARVFENKEKPKTALVFEVLASIQILHSEVSNSTSAQKIMENWM